jgi:hypothetical protein
VAWIKCFKTSGAIVAPSLMERHTCLSSQLSHTKGILVICLLGVNFLNFAYRSSKFMDDIYYTRTDMNFINEKVAILMKWTTLEAQRKCIITQLKLLTWMKWIK